MLIVAGASGLVSSARGKKIRGRSPFAGRRRARDSGDQKSSGGDGGAKSGGQLLARQLHTQLPLLAANDDNASRAAANTTTVLQ